jgi:hypothetical protein
VESKLDKYFGTRGGIRFASAVMLFDPMQYKIVRRISDAEAGSLGGDFLYLLKLNQNSRIF